jgi:hypothetical protein
MLFDVLFDLGVVILLVAGGAKHLKIILVEGLTGALVDGKTGLWGLVDFACHHGSE